MDEQDYDILDSWVKNAQSWIDVIEGEKIESRNLVTNKAIEEAILHYRPASILDLGCGQGWLTHRLHTLGIAAHGVDAIRELILSPGSNRSYFRSIQL